MPKAPAREAILIAMMKSILDDEPGFPPPRIALAQRAGVSRATLYRHHDLLALWDQWLSSQYTTRPTEKIQQAADALQVERDLRKQSDAITQGLAAAYVEVVRRSRDSTPTATLLAFDNDHRDQLDDRGLPPSMPRTDCGDQ